MNDTIYREDAIEVASRECHEFRGIFSRIEEGINGLSSTDRPQGKWKAKSFYEFFCDNCGFSFDIMKCDFLENMKFCPNCGARKGADDE